MVVQQHYVHYVRLETRLYWVRVNGSQCLFTRLPYR